MIETILTIGKCLLLSKVISNFSPIQLLLSLIPNTLFKNQFIDRLYSLFISLVKELFHCFLCCSFWTTLIYTGNIFMASGSYFISLWYNRFISKYEIELFQPINNKKK